MKLTFKINKILITSNTKNVYICTCSVGTVVLLEKNGIETLKCERWFKKL